MQLSKDVVNKLNMSVKADRVLEMAFELMRIPSPTQSAGEVANCLEEILESEGFEVHRPDAGWPRSPAVVTRFGPGLHGCTLQFNAHMDTVHLPFVPPRVEGGMLYGSGASDMKGGLAAMCEALIAVRESGMLEKGEILLTAHDLHEAPWGLGQQLAQLIREGYVGDAALLPEYLSDFLPVVGRGMAQLEVEITREGMPVHEVMGGLEQPRVILVGADLVGKLEAIDRSLRCKTHSLAGRESLFVGQISSGEIFNQSPVKFRLAGTRRWLPGTSVREAEMQFQEAVDGLDIVPGIHVEAEFRYLRDAFETDMDHPLVEAFQSSCQSIMGHTLPHGAKPFIDDANTLKELTGIEAITHGPKAMGAHTTHEQVPLTELVRVARVYACTAVAFCQRVSRKEET